jgi:ParB family chromosome partitioning protein
MGQNMSRKNLFADIPTPIASTAPPLGRPLQGTVNDPMSAVKRSVDDLNARTRRADEIEKSLKDGRAVIEIEATHIDPSFVQDRMEGDIEGLRQSIRDQGQQVPILVRLHPKAAGRYQVAFGHRRLRALKELGLPVKAVVRDLSDEQLVIAQGQENNERRDLTYIEKARYADRLKTQFSREVASSALSVDKSDLTRMLSVVARIPTDVIEAVGPAPGVGQRSWIGLAELLENDAGIASASKFLSDPQSKSLASAERFKALSDHLKIRPMKRTPDVWSTNSGKRLATVNNTKTKLEILIDRKSAPEFAALALERLQALYEELRAK